MTKKTNSLLLRYGISTFWQNKSQSAKVISNIIQLENLIHKELFNKNLKVLLIRYKPKSVFILVYNFFQFSNFLKQQVVNYYRQVGSLVKTIKKFGICGKYVVWILKSGGINKLHFNLNEKKLQNISLYKQLHANRWMLLKLYLFLQLLKISDFNKSVIISLLMNQMNLFSRSSFISDKQFLNSKQKLRLKYVSKKKRNKILNLNSVFRSTSRINNFLRRSQGLVYLNLVAVKLENTILWATSKLISVTMQNIFLTSELALNYSFKRNFEKPNERFLFYTLLLATQYRNSKLIGEFISNEIEKNKNHFRILGFFTKSLEDFFFTKVLKFKGFQLRLTGKLGGKMRKSKYHYKLGKVQLQTLSSSLSYSLCLSYTKFGVISIKTWLLDANS